MTQISALSVEERAAEHGLASRHDPAPGVTPTGQYPHHHPEQRSKKRLTDATMLRYFVFGSLAALSRLVALAALVEIGGVQKIVASVASFYVSVLINYFLQKRFTFNSSESNWSALPKFLAVSMVGACINVAIFAVLLQIVHYLVAQVIASLLVFMFNYSVSRMFIFFRNGTSNHMPRER